MPKGRKFLKSWSSCESRVSAATIDRALCKVKQQATGGTRRRSASSTGVRHSVPVRTFDGWNDPAPGFMEVDLVAHSGPTAEGSFLQTLTMTDIATGWTECAPLLVREQTVLIAVLSEIRKRMPFPLLGFDTDNDSVFMNEAVQSYCKEAGVAGVKSTRCRPYRKNDQAWVEQKNGAVVRRIVGYRRYVGLEVAAALGRLYMSVRLYVNFFQPSFKLASKARDGARVTKRYHPPATPYQRLLADPRTSETIRAHLSALQATLDPVRLLSEIRVAQKQLVEIADRPATGEAALVSEPTLTQFLEGLRTSWQEGEVRPTSKRKEKVSKYWRRCPDPFLTVTAQMREGSTPNRGERRENCWNGFRRSSQMLTRINCCERCSAVSKSGGGKARINWYSVSFLRVVNLSKPHCNP